MNSTRRIFSGAGMNMLGMAGYSLTGFLFTMIVARLFGPSTLGTYAFVFSIIGLVITFGRAGLQNSILKFVPPLVDKGKWEEAGGTVMAIIGMSFFFSASLSLVCLPFVDGISGFFSKRELSGYLRMLLLAAPFMAVNSILFFTFRAVRQFKYETLYYGFVTKGLQVIFIGSSYFLLRGTANGVLIVLLSVAVSEVIVTFLSLYTIVSRTPLVIGMSSLKTVKRSYVVTVLYFALPLLLTAFVQFGMKNTDTLMLGYFLPEREIGIYRVAVQVTVFGTVILSSFGSAIAPLISEDFARGDIHSMKKNYAFSTYWITVWSVPIFAVMLVFPEQILALFGKEFGPGSTVLVILALGQVVNAATGQCGYILMLTGYQKLFFFTTLISFVLDIILSYLTIPKIGVIGAGIASLFAITGVNLMRVVLVFSIHKIHPYTARFYKPIIAGCASVSAILLLKTYFSGGGLIYLAVMSAVMLTVYTSALFLIGFEKEEKDIALWFGRKLRIKLGF